MRKESPTLRKGNKKAPDGAIRKERKEKYGLRYEAEKAPHAPRSTSAAHR